MKKKILSIPLALLLIVSLVACAAPAPAPPELPTPPTTPEPITVTPEEPVVSTIPVSEYPECLDISIPIEAFSSQPHIDAVMNAAVGEELTVTLGSNPTTGFRWSEFAEISDETIVQQTSHTFVGPETTAPGTPGEEVWTFKALKKGTTTIYLEYSRPWVGSKTPDSSLEGGREEDSGLWTVTITANIKLLPAPAPAPSPAPPPEITVTFPRVSDYCTIDVDYPSAREGNLPIPEGFVMVGKGRSACLPITIKSIADKPINIRLTLGGVYPPEFVEYEYPRGYIPLLPGQTFGTWITVKASENAQTGDYTLKEEAISLTADLQEPELGQIFSVFYLSIVD